MEFQRPRPNFLTKIQKAKIWNFFRNNLFLKFFFWACWCLFDKPATILRKKEMKYVRSKPEKKQKKYIIFKNQWNSCKCFSGHVVCSLDKPLPPINTFLPDIPKSIDGHWENLRKYTFFKNIFSKTFFSSKTSSGHVECSLDKIFKNFSQKLEKWLLKIQKEIKLKTLRWKSFPKSSSGHANAVLTFLPEPLPKVWTFFAQCQKLFEKLHLYKTMVFPQNFHIKTRGMQFSHPSVREFSNRSSKTTNWMCEINDAKTFLSKSFSKFSARQVNAVSATPPFFFDQNSITLKFGNFFRKVLFPKFFFWAVQTTRQNFMQKHRKIPVQSR